MRSLLLLRSLALSRVASLGVAALGLASCQPDLGPPDSLVTSDRVLAIRAEPPESKPGGSVAYAILVGGPGGTRSGARAAWAFCATPKQPADNDIVSPECAGDGVRPINEAAAEVTAPTPADACALFGPDTPPGGFRPRDPDATGGYYQPVRARVDGAGTAFALERVTCNLAEAPPDVAHDFAQRYTPNQNPRLVPLSVVAPDGSERALVSVAAGQRVVFRAAWRAEDAESYVAFDRAAQALTLRRESMRVSWFATDGAYDADHSGRGEDDPATTTDDGWTAPRSTTMVHLWVVLRDSRGGVDFAAVDVAVQL